MKVKENNSSSFFNTKKRLFYLILFLYYSLIPYYLQLFTPLSHLMNSKIG